MLHPKMSSFCEQIKDFSKFSPKVYGADYKVVKFSHGSAF